ncbi:MAG: 3-deoxy-D-manno-octulosonic acid transferase [Pseudomonadota bacterium]
MPGNSLSLTAYLAASRVSDLLAWGVLQRRMMRGKEDPNRVDERRGYAGKERPSGQVIWLHGASIGETMSMLPLIEAFKETAPDAACLVTSGTVTSAKRMAELLPENALHQYVPVDTAASVKRFLDHWQPDLAILVESEFWPRLMIETAERGVPMALINARVSEESARKWVRAPNMIGHMLSLFQMIITQDRETGERLGDLGADPALVQVGGNLKALARLAAPDPIELEQIRKTLGDRPVWLAASTHAGEEEAVLNAHLSLPRNSLLILAPRHPERGDEVAEMMEKRALRVTRASWGDRPTEDTRVWLADTIGQMGLWLRLAKVTFVGGSLVPNGGHTPFEPALFNSAIIHGPHTFNFGPAYTLLAEAKGALQASSAADLAVAVGGLLSNDTKREELTDAAQILFKDVPDPKALTRELVALMQRQA